MIETVGVVTFDKNKVLLVKHLDKAEHPVGVYGLPAGRLRKGEKHIDGAKREFKEETGLDAETEDLEKLPNEYEAIIARKTKTQLMKMTVFYCKKYYCGRLKKSKETIPEWVFINKLDSYTLLPNIFNAIKEAYVLYC